MVQMKRKWHFGFFFGVYKIGVGLYGLDHSTFFSALSEVVAAAAWLSCSSFNWKLAKGMVGKPVFWKSGHYLAALGPLQY